MKSLERLEEELKNVSPLEYAKKFQYLFNLQMHIANSMNFIKFPEYVEFKEEQFKNFKYESWYQAHTV